MLCISLNTKGQYQGCGPRGSILMAMLAIFYIHICQIYTLYTRLIDIIIKYDMLHLSSSVLMKAGLAGLLWCHLRSTRSGCLHVVHEGVM